MIEEFGLPMLLPPLNFTLNVAFENIQLTWDSPTGKELTGYNIYYAFNGGDYNLLENTTETSYIVESPLNGLHAYYITAVYDEGESEPTNIQEVLLTATDEVESAHISIFPNPAHDFVFLNSDEVISSAKMYDFSGKFLAKKIISSRSHKLDISQLIPGIYFLYVENESGSFIQKVIKQ